ncbi:cilia- and flagella-associated protein 251-like isoform X2 [Artemia franciscana]|uniref:cilia- and flagella-associated protein 251-like isoform X2 n=1 Tax=Artemia franciscana TaxID=6661 RepID=UPI0032DB77BA
MFKENKNGDHDSGVDESTQEKEGLTRELSPKPIEEKPLVINKPSEIPVSPTKSATKIPSVPASPTKSSSSQIKSEPCSINNDDTPKKKLPMNKVQVGTAPSPNIKVVTSKIGSLNNTSYKPSGGNVKIESRKIVIEAKPRIGARNENYKPSGGDKKIVSQKLKWEAKSKIGSLDNTKHKPGGGKIKIETVKLDFSEKAKSKVGSTVNLKHVPGGGAVKNKSTASTPLTPLAEQVLFPQNAEADLETNQNIHNNVQDDLTQSSIVEDKREEGNPAFEDTPEKKKTQTKDWNSESDGILSSSQEQREEKIKKQETCKENTDFSVNRDGEGTEKGVNKSVVIASQDLKDPRIEEEYMTQEHEEKYEEDFDEDIVSEEDVKERQEEYTKSTSHENGKETSEGIIEKTSKEAANAKTEGTIEGPVKDDANFQEEISNADSSEDNIKGLKEIDKDGFIDEEQPPENLIETEDEKREEVLTGANQENGNITDYTEADEEKEKVNICTDDVRNNAFLENKESTIENVEENADGLIEMLSETGIILEKENIVKELVPMKEQEYEKIDIQTHTDMEEVDCHVNTISKIEETQDGRNLSNLGEANSVEETGQESFIYESGEIAEELEAGTLQEEEIKMNDNEQVIQNEIENTSDQSGYINTDKTESQTDEKTNAEGSTAS